MKKYFELLKTVAMFGTIWETDLEHMLNCLNAKLSVYKKGSMILLTGDDTSEVGIILSGNVQVVKENFLGNRTILTELSAGDIFGETFACAGVAKSPVTVLAVTGCEVLFIFIIPTLIKSMCIIQYFNRSTKIISHYCHHARQRNDTHTYH